MKTIKLSILIAIAIINNTLSYSQEDIDSTIIKSEQVAEILYKQKQYKDALLFYKTLTQFYLTDFELNKISGTAYYKVLFEHDTTFYYASIYKSLYQLLKTTNGAIPLADDDIRALRKNQNLNLYKILEKTKDCNYFDKVVLNDIFNYLNKSDNYHEKVNALLKSKIKASEPVFYPIGNPETIKNKIDYNKVKIRVDNTNKDAEKNIKSLALYLSKDMNEAEKAYAIYYWIEKNIKYIDDSTSNTDVNAIYTDVEYKQAQTRVTQTAERVLLRLSGVCEGFTNLFLALGKEAGLNVYDISGYAVNTTDIYDSHAWNMIKFDDSYYLIDVTWGDDEYFLSDPVFFNTKHFVKGRRQLLFKPYSENEFYKGLEKYAKAVHLIYPDSLRYTTILSKIYIKQKKYKEAQNLLENNKTTINNIDYWLNLADTYKKTQPQKSLKIYKKLLTEYPGNFKVNYEIAYLYRSNYQYDSAIFYYKQVLKKDKNNQIALRGIAFCYNQQKRHEEARIIAEKLLKQHPENPYNLDLMAIIYYFELDYAMAIKYYNKSLQIKPDNKTAIENLGMLWRLSGNIDSALFYNSKALKLSPNKVWIRKDRAAIYAVLKQFDKSYKILKELAEEKPSDIYVLDNLAWYALLTGRYDETFYYAKKAIEIDKNSAANNSLALAYVLTNQYPKAKEIYLSMKDKPYPYEPQYKTFGDFFLKWLNYAENTGIHHKDFKKVKKMIQ